jgi:flagellar assembly protein FliH
MLAKIIKDGPGSRFIPLSLPEIGDPTARPMGVSEFMAPAIATHRIEREVNEIIEKAPVFVAGVEDVLKGAHEEAAKIIADAEEYAASVRQESMDRAAIRQESLLDTDHSVGELRAQFAISLEKLSNLTTELTQRAERDLVDLALQIARKIVRREVTIDREVALTLVKVSLEKMHQRSVAEIRLNPEDLAYVEANRDKLEFRGSLEFIEDNSISIGGCLIHTDTGDIDARIESQFDEIAHGLFS